MSGDDWGAVMYSRHQLLTRISAHHSVLYSTGARFVWQLETLSSAWLRPFGRFHRQGNVVVDEEPVIPFRWARLPRYDRWATRRLTLRLQRQWDRGTGTRRVLWLFRPEFRPYVDYFAHDLLVYHACDLYSAMPGWNDELASYERDLCKQANLRMATSQALAHTLEDIGGRPVVTLTNGVDHQLYADAAGGPDPPDMAGIPHPRLGYPGVLNRKLDFHLLRALATLHPQWHFVMIGKLGSLDETSREEIDRCRLLANVHFLGPKPQAQIPAYVAGMDVGLVPYRLRSEMWTSAGNPLKLYEFLATGIPAVCCRMPSIEALGDIVLCADDSVAAWSSAIRQALAGMGDDLARSRRQAAASQRDWSTLARVALSELAAADSA